MGEKTAERIAYEAGWKASHTASDLDSAEGRFIGRHGDIGGTMFAAGWVDYAIDRPKFLTLTREHPSEYSSITPAQRSAIEAHHD